jgi:hypothetical protein
MKKASIRIVVIHFFFALFFSGCLTKFSTSSSEQVNSGPGSETVSPLAVIVSQFSKIDGLVGDRIFLQMLVNSSHTGLSYEWFKNGQAMGASNGPTLILDGAEISDTGFYHLVVSKCDGSFSGLCQAVSPSVEISITSPVSVPAPSPEPTPTPPPTPTPTAAPTPSPTPVPTLENVSLNKTVLTSSAESAHPGAMAVDGNLDPNFRWSADGYSQSMEIQLGAVYSLDHTELVAFLDRAYQYTIEVKENASEPYQLVIDRGFNTTAATVTNPLVDSLSSERVGFVRLTVSGCSGADCSSWISIVEFSVFGYFVEDLPTSPAPTPSPTPTPAPTVAANFHVTQLGSGNKDGRSFADSWSVAQFHSSSNWSNATDASRISPGNTVKFYGMITTGINPMLSGSAGKHITLDGSSATLKVSGVQIGLNSKNYINIDGFKFDAGINGGTLIRSGPTATKNLTASSNIIIQNCSYLGNNNTNTVFPLYITNLTYSTIEGNSFDQIMHGIYGDRNHHLTIKNNLIAFHDGEFDTVQRDVIKFAGASDILIEDFTRGNCQ